MNKVLRLVSASVCVALTLVCELRADVLVSYEFSGADKATPTSVLAGFTGSNFTPGTFRGTLGTQFGFSSISDSVFTRTDATGATTPQGDELSEAIASGYFWSFTLENTGPQSFTLDDLTFTHEFSNPFGTLQSRAFLLSSESGFAVGDQLGVGEILGSTTASSSETISLAALSSLDAGESTEFRLYITDNSTSNGTSSGNRFHRMLDVTVNGTAVATPVPEPSTATLFGLTSFGFLAYRRRQARMQQA